MTSRRAVRPWPLSPRATPRLAIVIRRSTNGRSSLARGTVVVRCSWRSRAVAWFRSMAMRCSVTRPSFRCATRCRMIVWPGGPGGSGGPVVNSSPAYLTYLAYPASSSVLPCRGGLIEPHAQAQPHRVQDFLDLVQALAAEVLGLQHLAFALLHQFANGTDVRVLEAVVGPHRELELLD